MEVRKLDFELVDLLEQYNYLSLKNSLEHELLTIQWYPQNQEMSSKFGYGKFCKFTSFPSGFISAS
jgi:hypothetical protein